MISWGEVETMGIERVLFDKFENVVDYIDN
jgi:hypothetical protein